MPAKALTTEQKPVMDPHFFSGIPVSEQRLHVQSWAERNNGVLPSHLAELRFHPGSETVGEWLAKQNNGAQKPTEH